MTVKYAGVFAITGSIILVCPKTSSNILQFIKLWGLRKTVDGHPERRYIVEEGI